ncbi:hypothetical protein Tco_0429754 [Tanacetum coccineum]
MCGATTKEEAFQTIEAEIMIGAVLNAAMKKIRLITYQSKSIPIYLGSKKLNMRLRRMDRTSGEDYDCVIRYHQEQAIRDVADALSRRRIRSRFGSACSNGDDT